MSDTQSQHVIFSCWRRMSAVALFIFSATQVPISLIAQSPDPAALLERFDRDSDQKLSREEAPQRLKSMFEEFDQDNDGYVSLQEMKQNLSLAKRGSGRGRGRAALRPGEVIAPAALQERNPEKLRSGAPAPAFKLPTVDGHQQIELRDLHRDKPVVLVFGSISCSPFRKQVEAVEQLYQQYKHDVNFVMIYIREAHPDSVVMVKNADGSEKLQKFIQTDDVTLRNEHAQVCSRTLDLSFPVVVDSVDNKTNTDYAGWPIRLVIIGTDGTVVDPGAQGPQGFQPAKLEEWLKKLSGKK